MNKQVFAVGAQDPERDAIVSILEWLKCDVRYAMKDGRNVHPGNAYEADLIEELPVGTEQLILIECEPAILPTDVEIITIDHHRPGNFGYGKPPSQFWQASSIGQLSDFLGVSMYVGSLDNLILAAMDHCFAAAFRGECPGISPQEVLERRIKEIAEAPQIQLSQAAVRERIAYFEAILAEAPAITIGGASVKDLRGMHLGVGYSLDYLTAQTAAYKRGDIVLLLSQDYSKRKPEDPEPPQKWSMSGHAYPEHVIAFRDQWAPSQGLVKIYAVPDRGYAGGYVIGL